MSLPPPPKSNKSRVPGKTTPPPASADFMAPTSAVPVSPSRGFDPLATPPKRTPPPAVAGVNSQPDLSDPFGMLSISSGAAPQPASAPAPAPAGGDDDPFDVFFRAQAARQPQLQPQPQQQPRPPQQQQQQKQAASVDDEEVEEVEEVEEIVEEIEEEVEEDVEEEKKAPAAASKPTAAQAGAKAAAPAPKPATAAPKPAAAVAKKPEEKKAVIAATDSKTAPPKYNKPFKMKVDVLKFMRKGSPLLKFGSYGYPHFRQFQLSNDNRKLQWYSSGKKITDSQVDLRQVENLVEGQTTEKFTKHPEVTQLEKNSFSLFYDMSKKTLDVIAKDPNEYTVWVNGLRELIKRAHQNHDLAQLKELVLDLTMSPNRRSNPDIVEYKTNRSILDFIETVPPKPSDAGSYDKARYQTVAQNLSYLRQRVEKYADRLKQHQYYLSPQYNTMTQLLAKVRAAIEKIRGLFDAGQFALCDDEIWRVSVDVDALKQMMKAIDASVD